MHPDDARVIDAHEAVLQAEGFVALQLGAGLDAAAQVLAMYARARGLALPHVARDVLAGRVSFGSGSD